MSLIFFCLAVLVLGKWRTREKFEPSIDLTKSQWTLRLIVIAALYVIALLPLDISAWRNPAVRAFYHGSDLTDFFTQIKSVFQIPRGFRLSVRARSLLDIARASYYSHDEGPMVGSRNCEWLCASAY